MHTRDDDRGARREIATTAMLDAAQRLFAERGYDGVSVRDIGAEAGFSHALVHRYLGSKQAIFRAVLARNENVVRVAAGDTEDLEEAISLMFREALEHHEDYLRLLVHSALLGLPFDRTIGRFAGTERLIELAEARAARASAGRGDAMDPRLAIAGVVALLLGWAAAGSWIGRASHVDGFDDATVNEALERIVRGIADTHIPGDG